MNASLAGFIALACALVSLFCVLTPIYVMIPFKAQGPRETPRALAIHRAGPAITAISALLAAVAVIPAWGNIHSHRTGVAVCVLVTILGALMARADVNEVIFRPYRIPVFGPPDATDLDETDMLISVSLGGETHAYSIGAMGYHHIVNDVVGGVPIAPTYCSLCHTGIVWNRALDGRVLTLHIAGIRNGNALLRDGETGSVWQQSTGEAIFGPLKGKRLEMLHSDELTFGLWRAEQPQGLILKPDARSSFFYSNHGWDSFVEKFPTVIDTSKSGIAPRELMLGIATASGSKAFPWKIVLSAGLIQDRVGTEPVLLVVGPDELSVRAFRTSKEVTFFRNDSTGGLMTDAETSSRWNFSGRAVSGPLAGQLLQTIDAPKHFWFDWQNYHPDTEVFRG